MMSIKKINQYKNSFKKGIKYKQSKFILSVGENHTQNYF